MSQDPSTAERRPEVCALVVMNHPFPANLPLLRQLYNGRFTHLRFIIPFERMDDPDVLTVYRGSYQHAGYLNDVRHELAALDCDYYLVIHDDVLLNPSVSEDSFLDIFKLGPSDGFIPRIDTSLDEPGRWIWSFAFMPKLLHPKSLLFGSGVEPENLRKYLPDRVLLADRMEAHGLVPTTKVKLDPRQMEDVGRTPSHMLLHGLAARLDPTPGQFAVDAASLDIAERLIGTMAGAAALAHGLPSGAPVEVELPFPVVRSGYVTDFYILPRSGLEDFCHYIGVASAAGLFVEIIVPTLLFACCESVRTADDLGLDFSGFDHPLGLDHFTDPRAIALHPFKLSAFRDPARADGLIALLDRLREGDPVPPSIWREAGLKPTLEVGMDQGWHGSEPWGRWSARATASFRVRAMEAGEIRLRIRAPLYEGATPLTGSLRFETADVGLSITLAWPNVEQIVVLEGAKPNAEGWVHIELTSSRLIQPSVVDPLVSDHRRLGIGICNHV